MVYVEGILTDQTMKDWDEFENSLQSVSIPIHRNCQYSLHTYEHISYKMHYLMHYIIYVYALSATGFVLVPDMVAEAVRTYIVLGFR